MEESHLLFPYHVDAPLACGARRHHGCPTWEGWSLYNGEDHAFSHGGTGSPR